MDNIIEFIYCRKSGHSRLFEKVNSPRLSQNFWMHFLLRNSYAKEKPSRYNSTFAYNFLKIIYEYYYIIFDYVY